MTFISLSSDFARFRHEEGLSVCFRLISSPGRSQGRAIVLPPALASALQLAKFLR